MHNHKRKGESQGIEETEGSWIEQAVLNLLTKLRLSLKIEDVFELVEGEGGDGGREAEVFMCVRAGLEWMRSIWNPGLFSQRV